jgi:diaminopimelate epimerase
MEIPFVKMHGCGNDFIMVDDPESRYSWEVLSALAKGFCMRRFGVGADGLIAVGHGPLEGEEWADGTDYEMRYVNADGSRAEMCGNGIRCLGRFAADVLGDNRAELNVLTGNGVLPIRIARSSEWVVESITVGMGVPRLFASEIPTTLAPEGEQAVSIPVEVGGERLVLTAVNMGNPHAVTFVDAITDHHVLTLGPLVETLPAFPKKVNAEFVQQAGEGRLRMRVWERGVGETWACGTGACASVVAAVLTGRAKFGDELTVELNGGELVISWPAEDQQVMMTGPAEIVYTGNLLISTD